jgi:glycosyltransferase involved in cell wall biosynthesis
MNLLMLSGDPSAAQGRDSTFYQMLGRFAGYWDRIDVICPPSPASAVRPIHERVFVHPSPGPKLLQPWHMVHVGRALMAERQYALVTSHDYGLFLNGLAAWMITRRTGVPYVSEIHHLEGYPRAATRRERLYRALGMRYIRWVSRHAAAIRAVNAVELPDLLRRLGVPAKKILVLPSLYIDFDVFQAMPAEPRRYDVITVGRLAANKGLFTLLDAVERVKVTHADVQLAILGQGPLLRALRARIEAQGLGAHVTIIPRLDTVHDLARFYNSARMLVCASTAEGGPRVTVEAMACGVPVISTPVGIMPEVLEDGVNGLLFRWDAAELADKIRLLLADADLRQRLGENGCRSVQRFRAEDVIEQYALGLQRLAKGTV